MIFPRAAVAPRFRRIFRPANRAARWVLAWVLALAAGEIALGAEPEWVTRNWLVEDGLPNDATTRLVQDRDGFLWVTTASGLARFDGREFKEYPLPTSAPSSSANIRDIAVDEANGLVMLPASGGVVRLRGREVSEHPAGKLFPEQGLVDIFSEPGGAVWLGTEAGQLGRWQNGAGQIFGRAEGILRRGNRFSFARDGAGKTWVGAHDFVGYHEGGRLVRFNGSFISGMIIAASRSGGIWVAAREGLFRIEGGREQRVCEQAQWRTAERGGVQVIAEDSTGAVWIGTRRLGVFRFTGKEPVPVPTEHKIIKCIFEDAERNIWIATDGGGISRLRPKEFTMVDASIGLVDDVSSAVCEDASGAAWSANRLGGVVRARDGKAEVIPAATGRAGPYAITISPDAADNIWVGATDGLYWVPVAEPRAVRFISRDQRDAHVMFGASNGDVWLAFLDDGFGFYREGKFQPVTEGAGRKRRIKAIAEDRQHRIWVATDEREIFECVDGRLVSRIKAAQVPGGQLYALYFDGADNLWITTSRGLVVKQGERFHLFTTEEGLPDNEVGQVLEDERGRLWGSCRRGLFSVARADLLAVAAGKMARVSVAPLGAAEGLQGASALSSTQPLAWRGKNGRLWFATHAGIVGIDSAAAVTDRPAPKVFIDEVRLGGRRAQVGSELRVPPGAGAVEFVFVALNYASPEAVRLRHRLVGFDADWVDTGADRRATYARLPPGEYALRVNASNAGGRWDEGEVRLAVVVVPSWWQRGDARAAAVLVFAGVIASSARYWSHRRLKARIERLEREHALEKERSRIARDLHDELGGSLTQIGMLADRLKRRAGEDGLKEGLTQLAARTRGLSGDLESIVWTVSPKNNTWDRLVMFIGLFAQRFFRETAIECSVEGVEDVPARPVSPEVQHHLIAIVKEALNNILKHARATRVTLTVRIDAGKLELRVHDNGVGFDAAPQVHTERNGLNNMRTRSEEIGAEIEFASGAGRGTELIVRCALAAEKTRA